MNGKQFDQEDISLTEAFAIFCGIGILHLWFIEKVFFIYDWLNMYFSIYDLLNRYFPWSNRMHFSSIPKQKCKQMITQFLQVSTTQRPMKQPASWWQNRWSTSEKVNIKISTQNIFHFSVSYCIFGLWSFTFKYLLLFSSELHWIVYPTMQQLQIMTPTGWPGKW